nr:RagB/SusD family nutrient uptake outer membrane protein [Fulvivirga sp. M361]
MPKGSIDLQTILDERPRELFFEGQRFFTLKRTNKLVSQISQYGGNDNGHKQARGSIQDFMKIYPFRDQSSNSSGPGIRRMMVIKKNMENDINRLITASSPLTAASPSTKVSMVRKSVCPG